MSTYTKEEVQEEVISAVRDAIRYENYETDNEGQIIFYSGLYLWEDGTVRDEPENKDDEG